MVTADLKIILIIFEYDANMKAEVRLTFLLINKKA
jgi:hypothetical protein